MALVILGHTSCPICGMVLNRGDDITSFPAFVANRLDPFCRFSDTAFHRMCFEREPLATAVVERYEEVTNRSKPGNRRCAVCADEIRDPDDYFGTGFLTEDPENAAHQFNYLHHHRSHFVQWHLASEFRRIMKEFLDSEAWDGPKLVFDPFPRWTSGAPGGSAMQS